jgi:hypothetical protein
MLDKIKFGIMLELTKQLQLLPVKCKLLLVDNFWYTHSILIPVDGSTTVGAAGDFASY